MARTSFFSTGGSEAACEGFSGAILLREKDMAMDRGQRFVPVIQGVGELP